MIKARKLPPSRWRDYKALRLESLKQSPLAFGSTFEVEARFSEREWRRRMRGVLFALDDGKPLGMIVCSFNNETKFRHIAEIHGFYVRAGHRGKGVGTMLLGLAIEAARRRPSVIKVRLYVNSQQRAALAVYEKAAFFVVGKLPREMKVGGRIYTMLVMERTLRR